MITELAIIVVLLIIVIAMCYYFFHLGYRQGQLDEQKLQHEKPKLR